MDQKIDVGTLCINHIFITYFSYASRQPRAAVFSNLLYEHIKDSVKHRVFPPNA